MEFLQSLGLPAIIITTIVLWWVNRKLKGVDKILFKDDLDKFKKEWDLRLKDLEKEINYLKDKVKTLPDKKDVEAIRTAVSGVAQGFKEAMEKDYDQEQKQWDNIHDVEKKLADLRVEVAEIKK